MTIGEAERTGMFDHRRTRGLTLISVIVPTASGHYLARMAAAVIRLLTLLALVLMPLGMAGAPAMAHAMPAQYSMASTGHCDEQPGQDRAPASKMDCAAMCTALPATDAPAPASVLKPTAPRTDGVVALFEGREPEIATPPPRQG